MSQNQSSYSNTQNKEMEVEVEQEYEASNKPEDKGTRREIFPREEGREPPGPACYKGKLRSRSRSGSASSASSRASDASVAMVAERKSRREQAHMANRKAATAARKKIEENPVIYVASGSEETEEEKSSLAGEDHSRKRKLEAEEGTLDPTDETQRKQGRPVGTNFYIGRAKAIEEWNRQKREAADLDNETILRRMTTDQIFSRVEVDLEDAMCEMHDSPTADVASRARECMAEVFKVAKYSRNLKGGYVKILKHAAVLGSASTEVLRTRVDNNSGSDNGEATRQLKALRRELETVRQEAQQAREEAARAKEEAETLRKELIEIRGKRGNRTQRRAHIGDSSSPSSSPERGRAEVRVERMESASTPAAQTEETPMDVEVPVGGDSQTPEYDDERRKKEILPPKEEWPAAYRPSIQGKIKILEDRPLIGHTVRVMDGGKRPTTSGKATSWKATEEQRGGGVQSFMDQITPLLEK